MGRTVLPQVGFPPRDLTKDREPPASALPPGLSCARELGRVFCLSSICLAAGSTFFVCDGVTVKSSGAGACRMLQELVLGNKQSEQFELMGFVSQHL